MLVRLQMLLHVLLIELYVPAVRLLLPVAAGLQLTSFMVFTVWRFCCCYCFSGRLNCSLNRNQNNRNSWTYSLEKCHTHTHTHTYTHTHTQTHTVRDFITEELWKTFQFVSGFVPKNQQLKSTDLLLTRKHSQALLIWQPIRNRQ